MFVLDSHCDTPMRLLEGCDLSVDGTEGHVDFPRLRKGGVDASFFALYIPAALDTDQAYSRMCRMMELTRESVGRNSDVAALAKDSVELAANKSAGKISIMLGLENGSPLGTDWKRFDKLCSDGVRYITLCHNGDNLICDSAAQASTHHGLSAFGKELVRAMNDNNILVDCAHISDESFWDVLKYSKRPVVSTHSCCRALCGHRRNMTDEMIRALASEGGVIQINFYPLFLQDGLDDNGLDKSGKPISYQRIADHIDHVVEIAGIDHVGIGTDFDGIECTPAGMEDVSKLPALFDLLRKRSYSETDLSKISGDNFLRVMNER